MLLGGNSLPYFLFDTNGKFREARIDDLGPRTVLNEEKARELLDIRMAELGRVEYGRIEVQPFAVERFGMTCLVPRAPEDENDGWWVELQPGNYMAFHEPWDSGEYDT